MPTIPVRARYAHEALGEVFNHAAPGLYFIVIEDGMFDDTMQHYLDGFFRSIGGQFYSKEMAPETTSPLDAELEKLIGREEFEEDFQTMRLKLRVIDQDDDMTTVGYQNQADGLSVPGENPSHRQLFRLVCMADEVTKAKGSIFGFIYDGARFDEEMIRRFDIIFSQLHSRIVAMDNMIVFFYTDDKALTFSRNYLWKSAIYWRIARLVNGGAVPLIPYPECVRIVREKAKRILESDTPLIFFLGAGTSIGSGMPSGDDVLDMALKELIGEEKYENRAQATAEFLSQIGNPGWLPPELVTSEHVISKLSEGEKNFGLLATVSGLVKKNNDATPTDSQRKIVEFCLKKKRAIILTTNLDTLIERASTDVEAVFEEERLKLLAEKDRGSLFGYFADRGKVGLIKLHGSIDTPLTLKIKWGDLEHLSPAKRVLLERLLNPVGQEGGRGLLGIPMVFLGYGFHDPDLHAQVRNLGIQGIQMVIVSPEPTLAMKLLAQQPCVPGADPEMINLDFESFIDAISSDG